MRILDEKNIIALSKLIYQTDVMPSGNSRSFTGLSKKIILAMQNGSDLVKLKRMISGELITRYGLSASKNDIERILELVYSWYREENTVPNN